MKNKKQARETLHSHGLALMDKAVQKKFGIDCNTRWSDTDKRWVTIVSDTNPSVTNFLSGYQQALNDMFIAARL